MKLLGMGMVMEECTKQQYITHQQQSSNLAVQVDNCGLFFSCENPWLAATPDGIVHESATSERGLLEIKNPHSMKDLTLAESCMKSSTFCLKHLEGTTFELK